MRGNACKKSDANRRRQSLPVFFVSRLRDCRGRLEELTERFVFRQSASNKPTRRPFRGVDSSFRKKPLQLLHENVAAPAYKDARESATSAAVQTPTPDRRDMQ